MLLGVVRRVVRCCHTIGLGLQNIHLGWLGMIECLVGTRSG